MTVTVYLGVVGLVASLIVQFMMRGAITSKRVAERRGD
jgi:hypothetical protein